MTRKATGAARPSRPRSNTGGAGGSAAVGAMVLGPKDSLKGELRIQSGVTIQGSVEGEIIAGGDVIVEPTATVVATIEGRNVDIRGRVTGNVRSSKRLSLSGSGTLQGDAAAGSLMVEDGATLNGSITMGGARGADQGTTPLQDEGGGDQAPAAEPEQGY